jgi:hypothetical protein
LYAAQESFVDLLMNTIYVLEHKYSANIKPKTTEPYVVVSIVWSIVVAVGDTHIVIVVVP